MDIITIQAERKLIDLVSSIGRDPASWHGWSCLHIDLSSMNEEDIQDCLIWIKSIVDSYLKDIEGRVYFANGKDIYAICHDVPASLLREAGNQISDLAFAEASEHLEYRLFDLCEHAYDFVSQALSETTEVFAPELLQATNDIAMSEVDRDFLMKLNQEPSDQSHNEKIRVLLVEDDPVTRWMVRNSLKNECEFATAGCANQAFNIYPSFQPDIVFLDIGLPDKNGRHVLEWVLRNDPGAYVVMFSSNNNLDNITNTLAEGAKGFIGKPFLKKHLLRYINDVRI